LAVVIIANLKRDHEFVIIDTALNFLETRERSISYTDLAIP